MMLPQGFAPSFPMQAYPGAQPGPQFFSDPNQTIGAAPPSGNWNPQVAQLPLPPRRLARAQVEDEPPAPQTRSSSWSVARPIPSPEELGVPASKPVQTAVDWTRVHNQLNQLGA